MNADEWQHPSFALPTLYPDWFASQTVKIAALPFARAQALTQAGDLLLVASPGHTRGHCPVVARTAAVSYFLAGDVTYDQQQLQEDAGAHQDFRRARATYRQIKSYAAAPATVYLPSHDAGVPERLQQNLFLP